MDNSLMAAEAQQNAVRQVVGSIRVKSLGVDVMDLYAAQSRPKVHNTELADTLVTNHTIVSPSPKC